MAKKDLQKKLTEEQYHILVEKGTEPAFSGKYVHTKKKGMYTCAACGNPLFYSKTKYDSGTGWPSFYEAIDQKNIKLQPDTSHGLTRTEVVCGKCGSHLGHLFDDGPKPTGKRYCINSASLDLKKDK